MKLHVREKIRYFFILQVLLFSTVAVWAQPVTVSGKITDNKAIGLAGVTVSVKGTSTAKVSDESGSFSVVVPNRNAVLVISSVGYVAQEIPVNGQRKINVSMVPDNQGLGEVVVVGYGSQLRKAVTGAVQTVQAKEFKDLPVSQITQKLQGRLAGVQINQVTGKPGQGMSVRIRGQLSVSAGSDPLYVVDGFPITGNISNLNPDEIENHFSFKGCRFDIIIWIQGCQWGRAGYNQKSQERSDQRQFQHLCRFATGARERKDQDDGCRRIC